MPSESLGLTKRSLRQLLGATKTETLAFLEHLCVKALDIAEQVEKVKELELRCEYLANRVGDLVLSIAEVVGEKRNELPEAIKVRIDRTETVLDNIRAALGELIPPDGQTRLVIVTQVPEREETLERLNGDINDLIGQFGFTSHLGLQVQVTEHGQALQSVAAQIDRQADESRTWTQAHMDSIIQKLNLADEAAHTRHQSALLSHDETTRRLEGKLDATTASLATSQGTLHATYTKSTQILDAVLLLQETLASNYAAGPSTTAASLSMRSQQTLSFDRDLSHNHMRVPTPNERVVGLDPSAQEAGMSYEQLIAARAAEGLHAIFFSPALFRRAWETDDSTHHLIRLKEGAEAEGMLGSVWHCSAEGDVNLRHLARNVPPGAYDILWMFGYRIKHTGKHMLQALIRCSVGKAINDKKFMARATVRGTKTAAHVNLVIYDYSMMVLGIPNLYLPTASEDDLLTEQGDGEAWIVGGVAGKAPKPVEVEEDTNVAILVKRFDIGGPKLVGSLTFAGVTLIPVSRRAQGEGQPQ